MAVLGCFIFSTLANAEPGDELNEGKPVTTTQEEADLPVVKLPAREFEKLEDPYLEGKGALSAAASTILGIGCGLSALFLPFGSWIAMGIDSEKNTKIPKNSLKLFAVYAVLWAGTLKQATNTYNYYWLYELKNKKKAKKCRIVVKDE